jgi:hypothetical protein
MFIDQRDKTDGRVAQSSSELDELIELRLSQRIEQIELAKSSDSLFFIFVKWGLQNVPPIAAVNSCMKRVGVRILRGAREGTEYET